MNMREVKKRIEVRVRYLKDISIWMVTYSRGEAFPEFES